MQNNKIIYIFILLFYLFTILASAKEYSSSLLYYTVFTPEKNSKQNFLLSYVNSTSFINSVSFFKLYEKNIANVSKNSELTLTNCSVSYSLTASSLFISSGKVNMDSFIFLKDFSCPTVMLPTFMENPFLFDSYSSLSGVNIQNSEISNAAIKKSEGTLLNKGNLDLQNVKNCRFYNLTIFDKKKEKVEDEIAEVSFCVMSRTNIKKVDDYIYGSIVSGLTLKTINNFECNNNTLGFFCDAC